MVALQAIYIMFVYFRATTQTVYFKVCSFSLTYCWGGIGTPWRYYVYFSSTIIYDTWRHLYSLYYHFEYEFVAIKCLGFAYQVVGL